MISLAANEASSLVLPSFFRLEYSASLAAFSEASVNVSQKLKSFAGVLSILSYHQFVNLVIIGLNFSLDGKIINSYIYF